MTAVRRGEGTMSKAVFFALIVQTISIVLLLSALNSTQNSRDRIFDACFTKQAQP